MSDDPVVSPPQLPTPAPIPVALAVTGVPEGGSGANCGAALQGGYCSACGQRHQPHAHSVAHFAGEAFESISHADSRLWRTLGLLVSRPGRLTREFFAGRRASYLPPFRLYLVISVLFFVTVGASDGVEIEIDTGSRADRIEGMKRAAQAVEAELADVPGAAEAASAIRAQAARESAELEGKAPESNPAGREGLRENNILTEFCKSFAAPDPTAGRNYDQLRDFCKKAAADRGETLARSVVHNIPRAMFVFLPLLALVMKLLYWRPRRYYVEHLLFLVHNHAFVFLALATMSLLDLIPVVGEHLGLLEFAMWIYMIWYIFRAMRVYYAQSRWRTFGKYLTIGLAYISTSVVVLVFTALFSALTL